MTSRFLPLILCLVCLFVGYKLTDINNGRTSESTVNFKKMLCEKSVKAGAMIRSEYTQVEQGDAIYYEYTYDFEVGEKTYSGTYTVSEELTIPIVEVFYNSDDPSNVMTSDPCLDYERIKDRPMSYPSWIENVGLVFLLIAIGFGRSSIVRAIKGNNVSESK